LKEDIFYYAYGILHSPKYRTAFSDDLKKALPRIPLAEKSDDFWAFSRAGRELARLHLEYESIAPLEGVTVSGDRSNCRVAKMRFKAKGEKDTIIFKCTDDGDCGNAARCSLVIESCASSCV